jgi:uroporphyrinogen decarboxylase
MPATRQPDFSQFLKVLTRTGKPGHLPCYEHIASPGFVDRRTGKPFSSMPFGSEEYWQTYVDFWIGMGYDCIPMEVTPRLVLPPREAHEGAVSVESEATACIRDMAEFEAYPWPDPADPMEFSHFETVGRLMPEGARIVGGVCAGPYEWSTYLMGVVGLSMAIFDQPELVQALYARLQAIYVSAVRQLATMDCIGALRQGDDLGFKTSTFLKPAALRRLIFPIYKDMAAEAHAAGKPFILHSCGNLANVYEDLIEDCKIDAKHSFEETILPVEEFKARYGARCTPLGGLDVDMICRADEATLRAYTRDKVEKCFADGYWALGTGNSLTDYMPVENYMIVLDEAARVAATL